MDTDTKPIRQASGSEILPQMSSDIGDFLRLLHQPGGVFEIRVPKCPYRVGTPGRSTTSGYYNDAAAAVRDVAKLESLKPAGIYVTVNPCRPELLARSINCLTQNATCTTADPDVSHLAWLFVDIDPVRPAGVSSTHDEMEAAIELAHHVRDDLVGCGWPDAVLFMSGNGAGLLFRIDMDNTTENASLVARTLQGLADRYCTAKAHVDVTTGNPARIMKLVGTTARKGSHLVGVDGFDDRPHRVSWFEPPTSPLNPVPQDLLESVAKQPTTTKATASSAYGDFDVEDFIRCNHLDVSEPREWPGNKKRWTLNVCPMCDHGGDGPYIGVLQSGAIAAGCHHDSCKGKWGWHELREKLEPKPRVDISAIERKRSSQQHTHDEKPVDDTAEPADPFADFPAILTGSQLIATYPELRPVIVEGLVRKGDICNIIAAPKVGKSWLALGLALSVASGQRWLRAFQTTMGRVLYIDNELDPSDSAWRLQAVADAMRVEAPAISQNINYTVFRGKEAELARVCKWLEHRLKDRPEGYYQLVVIDTLSKFLAGDKSENDNLYIRSIYARLERLASQFGFAIVIIHHSSRGDQSEKQITDVGAGAGAQSRACDTHIVIRSHSEAGWFVLDSTVRSFPANQSLSIQWEYPLWRGDPAKTPELASKKSKRDDDRAKLIECKVMNVLKARSGEQLSVNGLHGLIEGHGPITIRKACERLLDAGQLKRTRKPHRGEKVDVYYLEE